MNGIAKKYSLAAFIFLLFLLSFAIFTKEESLETLKANEVCFKENCFEVEIAGTFKEQIQGLMFKDSLEKNKGMLFIFKEEDYYPFWMKNTLIPLDIIWINGENKIVFIKENALPCSPHLRYGEAGYKEDCPAIEPSEVAKYVLEISGGISKTINLKLGDKVFFKFSP